MAGFAAKHWLTALLLVMSLHTYGEIYKVTDEDGKTTYTNIEPKAKGEGKESQKVDLKETNISEEGKHLPGSDDTIFNELRQEREAKEAKQQEKQQEKEAAFKALQEARENLEKAKEVKSGDFFNNPDGGLHYKDSYYKRIEEAKKQLDAAEERYKAAQ